MASLREHYDAAKEYQEYYDKILQRVGSYALPPYEGEKVHDYRRRILNTVTHTHLPEINEYYMDYNTLRVDALDVMEPQALKAVQKAAVDPTFLKPGEIRMIVKKDINGIERRDWLGREFFVKQEQYGFRPGRRVVSFTTDRGKYDAIKARWF